MLSDKITLLNGSNADNMAIVSGATLPAGSLGELFYKTETDEGLYYYDGIQWIKIGTGSGGGIETGDTLPAGTYVGQLFTKTGADANTYMFNGTEWVALVTTPPTHGNLWAWGSGTAGELGDNTATPRSSPVQIGSLSDWSMISADGSSTMAIKTDGTLWGWGFNQYGSVGVGTLSHVYSPTQVSGGGTWKEVDTTYNFTTAIKTDGTLWAWGTSSGGRSGSGSTSTYWRSTPGQIGTSSNWNSVGTGGGATYGIKTDGTLWGWGFYVGAALISTPIQIGIASDWKSISIGIIHAGAIKNDGTLWMWGDGYYGQTGFGNQADTSSPIQLGSGIWKQVSVGKNHTLAIKTDGTLWAWGYNNYGQIGNGLSGHFLSYSSPIQIGSLTNWKMIGAGSDHATAIKTDGTLWAWGYNYNGQLGLGDIVNRSSPTQVGSLTGWKKVTSGSHFTSHVVAIK